MPRGAAELIVFGETHWPRSHHAGSALHRTMRGIGEMNRMTAFVLSTTDAQTPTRTRIPVPHVGDDELLVRIKAVGVGIHDSYFLPHERTSPYPIGIEAAGIVDQVGSAVTQYHVGDRIAFVSAM